MNLDIYSGFNLFGIIFSARFEPFYWSLDFGRTGNRTGYFLDLGPFSFVVMNKTYLNRIETRKENT